MEKLEVGKQKEVDKRTPSTTPDTLPKPANYGQPDCQCQHCQNNRKLGNHLVINHWPYKTGTELLFGEMNRVTLPGDPDYIGIIPDDKPIDLKG